MSTPESIQRPATVAILLSFIAGYVDAVGFVALLGLFTAHVTGNFILIGTAVAHARGGLVAKLAALPMFILAVSATTVFVQERTRANKPALVAVLAAQLVFLAGFMAVGLAAAPILDVDAPLAVCAGMLGVCAMGIQNAASRLLMGELPPTTVMTGGVTQFAIDATHLLRARVPGVDAAAARKRLGKFVPPVAAFALGAVAGAVLYTQAGFGVLLLPMLALVAVMLLLRRPITTAKEPT